MKLHYRIIIFLTLYSSVTFAAEIGFDDIPLTWKNFVARKDFDRHPYSAKIYTPFTYHYNCKEEKGKWTASFEMKAWVDREKSWVKRKFLDTAPDSIKNSLIFHEKGHFIIALIEYKKLQSSFKGFKFSKKIKQETDSMYKVCYANAVARNERYDLETNHMLDVAKQKEWMDLLLKELNELYADEKKLTLETDFKVEMTGM